jgi:NADPH:quinone reductase-like Zn-dependent oxidoreductase
VSATTDAWPAQLIDSFCQVFDLAQVKEAHDMMEANQNSGKIVLRVARD